MKASKSLKLALAAFALLSQAATAEPAWPPDTFSCFYGKITPQAVQEVKEIDLLIVHPGDEGKNLNKAKVDALRQTGREKTIVGYVSVGEDDRPPGGPPIIGQDTSGPSYVGPKLKKKKAQNGYPAQFLDQRRFVFGDDGFLQFGPNGKPLIEKGQDGHPDENGVWGSFYVRTDVEAWRQRVFSIMDDLVETGVDGFFLDTVDTASPWGDYGWTSESMLKFVEDIRKRYPDKKIVGNRGLFYLNQNDRYAKALDAVLFESLLTHYNWEADTGDISPWAKWHVKALDEEVVPSVKRTGMHLLVLDYLNPKQEDALELIQSDRTLLQGVTHSLSFSHPSLKTPGWTPQELLPDEAPAAWPSLSKLDVEEGAAGEYSLTATFDSAVPKEAVPDLRITTRDDLDVSRAAQLPPAQMKSWKAEGNTLTMTGNGLDKNQEYRVFLRLISRSDTPQTGYGWTNYQSKDNELPSQIQNVSAASVPEGLKLSFTADSLLADKYRVYHLQNSNRELLVETKTSPVILPGLKLDQVYDLQVVAVTKDGQEGYPSLEFAAVRKDVVPPSPPGAVEVTQDGETTRFAWQNADGAESYRLYVVPKGKTFRLPLLTSETEEEIDNVVPGDYQVFLTAVDGNGNQSRPGPRVEVTIRE